jgi:hypothetical protein
MPVVVFGTLALAGYVTVRRALDSTVDSADVEPAIDITVIESAVEENGLRAVAETETLEAAINDDELGKEIDVQRLQSAVEEKMTTVEQAVDADDIDSILADEFDAATDRGLSAITEQEVVEGTIDEDKIGVSVDIDELRSVLDSGTTALERTTAAVAEKIDAETDSSMLDTGRDESMDGQRIAVVNEQGNLESLVDESGTPEDSQSRSIDIEDGDDRTEDLDE